MDKVFIEQIKTFNNQLYELINSTTVAKNTFNLGESYNELFSFQESLRPKIEELYKSIIINGLLRKLFLKYHIDVEWKTEPINDEKTTQLNYEFVITKNNKKIGYLYNDRISELIFEHDNINEIQIIDWTSYYGGLVEDIKKDGKTIIHTNIHNFVTLYFDNNCYEDFIEYFEIIAAHIEEAIGCKTVRILNKKNFHIYRMKEEKMFIKSLKSLYCYTSFINNLNIENKSKDLLLTRNCAEEFIEKKYYLIFTGENEISRSFLTSEYLYEEYKYSEEFDITFIITGYLKSIEQLLYRLCLEHLNRGLKIKRKKDNKKIQFKYENLNRIDTTLNSLIAFLICDNYKHTLLCSDEEKNILYDCLINYKTQCRNSHFHKDVITRWSKVETIRTNTLFLYCLLLVLSTHNIYYYKDYYDDLLEY